VLVKHASNSVNAVKTKGAHRIKNQNTTTQATPSLLAQWKHTCESVLFTIQKVLVRVINTLEILFVEIKINELKPT